MLEQLQSMTEAIEMGSSPAVNAWINWMGIVFLASVIFAWKHNAARMTFVVMVLTVPTALLFSNLSNSIHLIGLAHIILWAPLAYYLVTREIRGSSFGIKSPFGIWVILLTATILISLFFDVRDTFLVAVGQK